MMRLLKFVWLAAFSGLIGSTTAMPAPKPAPQIDIESAKGYLERYGYINAKDAQTLRTELANAKNIPTTALELYQKRNGLAVTGLLDEATQTLMRRPRCGMPDLYPDENRTETNGRYELQGYKWSNHDVYYQFLNYSDDLSISDTIRTIERAFKYWSDVTPLTFTNQPNSSNIDILWGEGEHGDDSPFDGPGDEEGNTLAHAFYPNYGGDLHFDEHELWTVDTDSDASGGTDLLFVATHEIGHALGLRHSYVLGAVMYPYYPGYDPDLQLHSDDVAGIQALYGDTGTAASSTTSPSGSAYWREFCDSGRVDAIARFDSVTYVFQGVLYARVDNDGIVFGYPRRISDDWPGLYGYVDGALDWSSDNNYLLIFKDDQVYRYYTFGEEHVLSTGYPKLIAEVFYGLPSDIDLAFQWGATLDTYIFTGDSYYRLDDSDLYSSVASGYPKPISGWNLGDSTLSAAYTTYSQQFVFMYQDQYVLYNDVELQPEEGYPRSIRTDFFQCDTDGGENGSSGLIPESAIIIITHLILLNGVFW